MMYRQTVSRENFTLYCRRDDFKNRGSKSIAELTEEFIESAWLCYESNFRYYPFRRVLFKGKPHFIPAQTGIALMFRKISHSIGLAFPALSNGRNQIVRNVASLLAEGMPYNIHRFDVRNFYESFDAKYVKESLAESQRLSPDMLKLIGAVLDHQIAFAESGLPRGTHLSAQLSEILMSKFDALMRSESEVFFYSRFVDDMIMLTSSSWTEEKARRHVEENLPEGLELNRRKTKSIAIDSSAKGSATDPPIAQLDFLGYRFNINSSSGKKGSERTIKCLISEGKVSKIKTRIYRALFDYSREGDVELLVDRFKFLTSNFKIRNGNSGKTNISGIYFNYSLIEKYDPVLVELDKFLHRAVLTCGSKCGPKGLRRLPSNLRARLLRCSFKRGHNEKLYTHFSGNRLALIGECWKY